MNSPPLGPGRWARQTEAADQRRWAGRRGRTWAPWGAPWACCAAERHKDGSKCQVWRSDPGPHYVGREWIQLKEKGGSNHQVWCSDPGPRSVGTERMNTADSGNDGSCFYMLCDRNNNVNTDMVIYLH